MKFRAVLPIVALALAACSSAPGARPGGTGGTDEPTGGSGAAPGTGGTTTSSIGGMTGTGGAAPDAAVIADGEPPTATARAAPLSPSR